MLVGTWRGQKDREDLEGPQPTCQLRPLLLCPSPGGCTVPPVLQLIPRPHAGRNVPEVLGTDPAWGTAWEAASAFGHHEHFAMASLKIPAWGSDFSICLGTNESLGFSFPFISFKGILGKFSVLMGSSGSDFVAIHEGHQEKLDFSGKLGEGGGYPLARCLPAHRHRDQPHP